MDAAAAPLLEKAMAGEADLELPAKTAPSRPQRRTLLRRWILPVLLPLGMALALCLTVASHHHFNCMAMMSSGPSGPSSPKTALVAVSRRAEAAAASTTPEVLECFQLAPPVLTPEGPTTDRSPSMASSAADGSVTVTLMDYVFGNSYGKPYIGNYVPPSIPFNRVVMNFTVVSEGRQFDRLALMYLNDTEVWRTSTAEPTVPPGIRWVYLKDMTPFLSLWRTPQKLIFDLGNIQNDKYTGSFNTTLTATFFQADETAVLEVTGGAPPSDVIIPISARKAASNGVSQFTLPQDNATNTITNFPRNARRAVFSVSANGQADEEFWWSNVLQSDVNAFDATAGSFPGYSPFREVQVFIDGSLAGVQWPFPIVFTGGVVPSLHRPIVGVDDFDLREHEIDITPWLPLLCDGQPHTFTIQVAGINDDGVSSGTLTSTVNNSWYVTGKIFIWLDGSSDSTAVTTGSAPVVRDEPPSIQIAHSVTTNATGANETLHYTVVVKRSFSVHAVIASTGAGGRKHVATWAQSLSYSNDGLITQYGYDQVNNVSTIGQDSADGGRDAKNDAYSYNTAYSYPLYCNTTVNITDQGNLTLWAHMVQGLDLQVSGDSVFPSGLEAFSGATDGASSAGQFRAGSLLKTHFDGTASFYQTGDGKNSSGFGTTNQYMHFGGLSRGGMLGSTPDVMLYSRNVTAANQTILFDYETIKGVQSTASESGDIGAAPAAATGPQCLYAQAPLDGGTGSHVFTGRGGDDPEVAVVSVQKAVAVGQTPMIPDVR